MIAKAFNYIKDIRLVVPEQGTVHLVYNIILVGLFILVEILYKNRGKMKWLQRTPAVVKIAGFALIICLIIVFAVDTSNEFIYFRF